MINCLWYSPATRHRTALEQCSRHRMTDGTEKPIGFSSRTLGKAEQKYSQLDKEALAIIFGVKKYHQYVFGRQFEIKTDHKPFTHIFSESRAIPTMASSRLQRWALLLGAYDYTIQYKEGKENANADALSRLPPPNKQPRYIPKPAEVIYLMEHLDTSPLTSSQIRAWTDRDPLLEGWPMEIAEDQDLTPYIRRRYELSVYRRWVFVVGA